jgi:drug/metabolite transporter (DMT)-like permease
MSKKRHLLEIHLAVLLFGMAGLFGKWVTLPATIIVLGRVFFATLSLWVILRWRRSGIFLRGGWDYLYLALLGVLLAVHWITFFEAIQVSTVAIGLLTFSTFPVFTALLEPLFFRERWLLLDLLLALITFAGVALVIPAFDLNSVLTQGALWGIASGATFAVLSILNRLYVQRYYSLVIAFYQDLVATIVLLPALWWLRPAFSAEQVLLLIILGVVFTATSHSLFISGLKSVKAKTASIIGSLEPVYGIAAAAILLGETPSGRVLLGGLIILAATTYATLRSNKKV